MSAEVIGAIGIGLLVSGAVGGAYSAWSSGKSQESYYNFLADQSRLKAQLAKESADQAAGYAQDEGARAGHQLKIQVNQIEAQQKSSMIAQGMALNSVTAEDIIKDNISKAQLDEMAIRYNAELKAYQAERAGIMQAFDFAGQAGSQAGAGQIAMQTGRINAYSSLLGGLGQAGMGYYAMNNGKTSGGSNNQQDTSYRGSGYGGYQNYQGYGQRPSTYA